MGFKRTKEQKIALWDEGYLQHRKLIKCPECGVWFDKPDWHYIKCPMCDNYLKDERESLF